MTNSTELKPLLPCPFCSGKPRRLKHEPALFSVECGVCRVEQGSFLNPDDADRKWNRRPSPQPCDARARELLERAMKHLDGRTPYRDKTGLRAGQGHPMWDEIRAFLASSPAPSDRDAVIEECAVKAWEIIKKDIYVRAAGLEKIVPAAIRALKSQPASEQGKEGWEG